MAVTPCGRPQELAWSYVGVLTDSGREELLCLDIKNTCPRELTCVFKQARTWGSLPKTSPHIAIMRPALVSLVALFAAIGPVYAQNGAYAQCGVSWHIAYLISGRGRL